MSPAASDDGAGLTRSGIENWDTSYLDTAATAWRLAAAQSEAAFAQHRQNVYLPGGTTWEGDAKDAAFDRVTADVVVVDRQGGVLREAADIAENGRHDINTARSEAVATISGAENDGFSVAEDLSVTDTKRVDFFSMRARQNSLNEHAEDIRWYANRLTQTDSFVGERLQAKAAELDGIKFDGEDEGRDSGEIRVRLVDNKNQHDTEGNGEPGDKKPAVPGPAPGQIGPFAVPKSVEDAAKKRGLKPDEKPPAPTADDSGLGDLLGANDHAEHKPSEQKDPGLPPALSRLPAAPDKATIDQQRARVEAARQHLAAAEAKQKGAAGQGYVQGAGSGPSPDEFKSLTQAVFDARRELTEQTDAMRDLSAAAAAHGGPTVPVPPLPESAEKQAFPPPPSISDTLADANHQLSENTFGLIPDVATDIDTLNNWGQASGADKAGAILDAAGMLPLPFGKPLAEGLEHGLDALGGVARHADDVRTPDVDIDPSPTRHSHLDAPSGGHTPDDTPLAPHTDVTGVPSSGHSAPSTDSAPHSADVPAPPAHVEAPAFDLTTDHAVALGADPARGGSFVASEAETGLRIEHEMGVNLSRAESGASHDWVDASGRTYDAVGNFPSKFFDAQWSNLQDQIIRHADLKAEIVPVDVSKFTAAQQETVREFVQGLNNPNIVILGGQ